MAKDSKKRKRNKALKRAGIGLKYLKSKGTMDSWQERYNKVTGK